MNARECSPKGQLTKTRGLTPTLRDKELLSWFEDLWRTVLIIGEDIHKIHLVASQNRREILDCSHAFKPFEINMITAGASPMSDLIQAGPGP